MVIRNFPLNKIGIPFLHLNAMAKAIHLSSPHPKENKWKGRDYRLSRVSRIH